MNIEKYTQNTQSAIMEAQNIAVECGNQTLEPEHIHLALLRQKDGLIPKLLTYMNVDYRALERDVADEVDKLPKVSGSNSQPGMTARFSKILMNAEKISENHLLVA